jgi:hypothetical protein
MKRKLGIILLAALAIEAVNFSAGAGYALDPGSSSADPWYMQLLGFEWGALHAAGFFVLDVLERGNASPSALGTLVPGSPRPVFMVPVRLSESGLESFLHNHRSVKLPPWGGLAVLLGGGYLSTVLVLLAITLGFSLFLRWRHKSWVTCFLITSVGLAQTPMPRTSCRFDRTRARILRVRADVRYSLDLTVGPHALNVRPGTQVSVNKEADGWACVTGTVHRQNGPAVESGWLEVSKLEPIQRK